MAGQVRQRRGAKQKTKQKDQQKTSSESPTEETTPAQQNADDETLWQTFHKHPLVRVLPFVLTSYGIYLAYFFFQLQRPDLLSPVVNLRPAIKVTDERQLLIVGTMSSGTVQVATDLSKTLGVEMGHETSDAEWNFVRDGTVSWFHGIRFMEKPKDLAKRWWMLCGNYTDNMGFHPNMYKSSECSSRVKWNKCWQKQCYQVLNSEWGCALESLCETPFRTTLLQVRHPLRTMESLVTKFCQGGLNGTIHPSFVTFASALFDNHDFGRDNCIEATAHYIVEYVHALKKAQSKGYVAEMYRIEETTPCEIARLAGWMDPSTTIYARNHERIVESCKDDKHPANQIMESTEHKVNVGLLSLTWDDLRGGKHASNRPQGDSTVERQIKKLTKTLGYDTE